MKVGELFVSLGMKPDASWHRGVQMFRDMHHLAWGMAGIFGVKGLGGALIGFNIGVENAKNQIQGMLALARKTDFTSQLKDSEALYQGIRKAAMELPGETEDYVNMLGYLVQPLANANTSIDDMIELTSKARVMAMGLGEGWQKSARDISEFINFGKYNATDMFIRRVLGPMGFDNLEKSRKKFKAMTAEQRRDLFMTATRQPAVAGIIDATKNSTAGRIDKFKDQLKLALGKIGEGLTKAIGPALERAGDWLQAHTKEVEQFAERLGSVLSGGFKLVVDAISWLSDHGDIAKSILVGIAAALGFIAFRAFLAWAAVLWPVLAGAGAAMALFYLFEKLQKVIGKTAAAFVTLLVAKKIWDMVKAMRALRAATAATAAAAAGGGVGGATGAVGRIARAMGMGGGGSVSSLFMGGRQTMGFGPMGYNYATDAAQAAAKIAPGSFNFGPAGYNAVADMGRKGIVGKLGRVGRVVAGAGSKFKTFLGSAASIIGRASPWIMGAMVASEFLPDSWKNAIGGAISSGWKTLKGFLGVGVDEERRQAKEFWNGIMAQVAAAGGPESYQKFLRNNGDKTVVGLERAISMAPTFYISLDGSTGDYNIVPKLKKTMETYVQGKMRETAEALAKANANAGGRIMADVIKDIPKNQYIMIDDFLIDVSIHEDHNYDSEVTDYPTESGSSFADNIRKRPITVTIEGLISNTPIGPAALYRRPDAEAEWWGRAGVGNGTDRTSAASGYLKLNAIWNSREPITIITSLTTYERMAMTSLAITRDASTGDALHFTAAFQQIEIAVNERLLRKRTATRGGGSKRRLGSQASYTVGRRNVVWNKGRDAHNQYYVGGGYFFGESELVAVVKEARGMYIAHQNDFAAVNKPLNIVEFEVVTDADNNIVDAAEVAQKPYRKLSDEELARFYKDRARTERAKKRTGQAVEEQDTLISALANQARLVDLAKNLKRVDLTPVYRQSLDTDGELRSGVGRFTKTERVSTPRSNEPKQTGTGFF